MYEDVEADDAPCSIESSTMYISKGYRSGRRKITEKDRELLKYIVAGYTSAEIAETMGLSKKTIDNQRQTLLYKLDAKNIIDLAVIAVETGLVITKNQIDSVIHLDLEGVIRQIIWFDGFAQSEEMVKHYVGKNIKEIHSKELAKSLGDAMKRVINNHEEVAVEGSTEDFPEDLGDVVYRRIMCPQTIGNRVTGIIMKIYRVK